MIVATLRSKVPDLKDALLLVIDAENIRRLQQDQPIMLDPSKPPWTEIDLSTVGSVIVAYKEPLEDFTVEALTRGWINQATTIHPDHEGPSPS